MNKPFKIIYKYKNKYKKNQYNVYIFIGNLIENKPLNDILKKIKNISLYDTFMNLSNDEHLMMIQIYGNKWYKYFFNRYHVANTINNIKSQEKRNDILKKKLGNIYNEYKINEIEIKRVVTTHQSKRNTGIETENKNETQEEIDINEFEKTGLYDEKELEDIKKITNIEDDNPEKTQKMLNELLHKNKNYYEMIEFNNDNYHKSIDEDLSNVFIKYYVTSNYIYTDDTIKNIKKKICCSIKKSNMIDKETELLIPSRIYLWTTDLYLKKSMLGQKWLKNNELINIDIEPTLDVNEYQIIDNEKIKNIKDIMTTQVSKIKYENEDNVILSEYLDRLDNNDIYMIDIYNEFGLGVAISNIDLIYETYIKLYFNDINKGVDLINIINYMNDNKKNESELIEKVYISMNNELTLENEIMKYIENIKYNKKKLNYFENNNLIHVVLFSPLIEHNLLTNINNDVLDMYRIFDKYVTSEKYPYIQYKTGNKVLVYKIHKENVESNKELLHRWLESSPYDLCFKIKIKDKSYVSINILSFGKLEFKYQWTEMDKATIEDINNIIDEITYFINKINDENNKYKYEMTGIKFDFINSIQKFSFPEEIKNEKTVIDHNELSNFARLFFPYVSVVVDPRKREAKKSFKVKKGKYGTYLRYKRISNYNNEAKIEQRIIYFLKNYDYENEEKRFIDEMSKQFNLTEKQASEKIIEVKRKFSNLKKNKILKKFENIPKFKLPGIGIEIQGKSVENYKIKIIGSRSYEQLTNISLFTNALIDLYYDIYIYKKKEKLHLLEILKSLTNVAKRMNKIDNIVDYDKIEIKNVKKTIKLDKERLGYKPTKGQRQWTSYCQNSGDQVRQPEIYKEDNINDILELGYVYDEKLKTYVKRVNGEEFYAANLEGKYYVCDESINHENKYIGFLDKPKVNKCLPCCFKKNQLISKNLNKRKLINNCIDIDGSENTDEERKESKYIYILNDLDKLHENKFYMLPKYLNIFLNDLEKNTSKIENHYLLNTDGYFFAYYPTFVKNNYLSAISYLFDISPDDIIKKINLHLTKNNLTFNYLNNGDIKLQFLSIENYIYHIQNNNIDYQLIDDIICLPTVLYEYGANIYIFKADDDIYGKETNMTMLAKNYENVMDLFEQNRKTFFIIKKDNNYYPIVYIKKNEDDVSYIKYFDVDNYPIVDKIMLYYKTNCIDSIINIDIYMCAKLLSFKLLNIGYDLLYQSVDTSNKCTHIIISKNNKSFVLPVIPSGPILYLNVVKNYSKYLHDINDTIKIYKELNEDLENFCDLVPHSIEYKKEFHVYNINNLIINVKYNLLLPIIDISINKENLKKLSDKLGLQILKKKHEISLEIKKKEIDDRIYQVSLQKHKDEEYELLRLELNYYFISNKKISDEIYNIIISNINIIEKQSKIKKILFEIINNNFTFIDDIKDIVNYSVKNYRTLCKDNFNKYHCKYVGNVSKFVIPTSYLDEFLNKLSYEIITNEIKLFELLGKGGYDINDIVNKSIYTEKNDQLLFKNNTFNIKNILSNIFESNMPIIGKKRILSSDNTIIEESKKNQIFVINNIYYQKVYSDRSVLRAYINCYNWIKSAVNDENIKNLGYYSEYQTKLLFLFISDIINWLSLKKNKKKIKIFAKKIYNIKSKTFFVDFILSLNNNVIVNHILFLYILHEIHHFPIYLINASDVQYCRIINSVIDLSIVYDLSAIDNNSIIIKSNILNFSQNPSESTSMYIM